MTTLKTKTYLTLSRQSSWKVDDLALKITSETEKKGKVERFLRRKLNELKALSVAYRRNLETSSLLNTDTLRSYAEYHAVIEEEVELIRERIEKIDEVIKKLREMILSEHLRKNYLDNKLNDSRSRDQKHIDRKIEQELEDLFLLNSIEH